MKLRYLELFLGLSDNKSFTEASEKLGVSQPYLSSKIRLLENELGTKLINRKHTSNSLTPSGEIVKRRTENIINEINLALEEINDLAQLNNLSALAIGTNILDAPMRLSVILSNFQKRYPTVKLSFDYYSNIDQAIQNGVIDIALGLSFEKHSEDILVTPLVTEEYSLFVNKSHPLTAYTVVQPEMIFHYPMVKYAPQFCERKLLDRWESSITKEQKELSTWDFSAIYLMLTLIDSSSTENEALAILPFSIKEFTEEFKNIEVLEIENAPCREVVLLTAQKNKDSECYAYLIKKFELIF
ncbi:LysR family transcriptional regulator [Enterococcus sp. AZ072]|uniref:LysR family transcriptional regulator n=1 Tax=unclassified Enterococcus TaxID=2608891 RepID=UPI003D2921FD